MLLTILPLHPVFPRLLYALLWWQGASLLRDPSCSSGINVAWWATSCNVAVIFGSQYERILWRINYRKHSIWIPLSTNSLYTLSHLSALFHRPSAYLVGHQINCCVSLIMYAAVSAMISSVSYVTSKYLRASQCDFTVSSSWSLYDLDFKAVHVLSAAAARAFHEEVLLPNDVQK